MPDDKHLNPMDRTEKVGRSELTGHLTGGPPQARQPVLLPLAGGARRGRSAHRRPGLSASPAPPTPSPTRGSCRAARGSPISPPSARSSTRPAPAASARCSTPSWRPRARARRTTAERALIERLRRLLRRLSRAVRSPTRARVRRVLGTIVEGMREDLTRFPGEDAGGLVALEIARGAGPLHLSRGRLRGRVLDRDPHRPPAPAAAAGTRRRCRRSGCASARGCSSPTCCATSPATCARAAAICPSRDLALLGLEPRDLLDPAAGPALRPLLVELLNVALDHYEAGWQYTFAIPRAETRMRLACAWPLLIGLRTLDLLATHAQLARPRGGAQGAARPGVRHDGALARHGLVHARAGPAGAAARARGSRGLRGRHAPVPSCLSGLRQEASAC